MVLILSFYLFGVLFDMSAASYAPKTTNSQRAASSQAHIAGSALHSTEATFEYLRYHARRTDRTDCARALFRLKILCIFIRDAVRYGPYGSVCFRSNSRIYYIITRVASYFD